jgi:predicted nucleotide-binding protein (sugar kinase/HSP70/actin superfamily)
MGNSPIENMTIRHLDIVAKQNAIKNFREWYKSDEKIAELMDNLMWNFDQTGERVSLSGEHLWKK